MTSVRGKRIALFLFGCVVLRSVLVIVTHQIDTKYLPYLGVLALLPSFGFLYLFISGSRKTGAETFGKEIWWNPLRPVHSLLYLSFAIYAIQKKRSSYKFLLADVTLGLVAFTLYHTIWYDSAS